MVEIWDESEGSPMIVSRPVSYKNFKPISNAKVFHLIEYSAYQEALLQAITAQGEAQELMIENEKLKMLCPE